MGQTDGRTDSSIAYCPPLLYHMRKHKKLQTVPLVFYTKIFTVFTLQQQNQTYPAESRKLTLTFLPEPINSANNHQS